MPNLKAKISSQNKKILKEKTSKNEKTHNCTRKEMAINSKCLSINILYTTNLKSSNKNY